MLETPGNLEKEVIEAERELNGLILEKVCVTEKIVELANKNANQHVHASCPPQDTAVPSPESPQIGKEK